MLGDVDRQQSTRTWLGLRPANATPIGSWEVTHDEIVRPPKGTTHVVLDTPAGIHGKRLDEVMRIADKVLVPLQPSIFDIHATHQFVRELKAHRRSDKVQLAIVGMRTKEHTISTDQLRAFLDKLGVPLLGFIRDTQNYVHLAAHGLTLWDVGSSRFERDVEQWQPITQWLDR
jgi:chromosome partitioning protein